MSDKANEMLPVFRKAHEKASDYIGKASVWLLLAALALRGALRGEEVKRGDGKAFPQPEAFTADDRKALAAVLIEEAGCDAAAEAKAAARYKGNSDRVRMIARDYRNRRNAAARDVQPALACAILAKHWGKDAQADYAKGKVSIPAAWFLPANHAPAAAQALLSRNPLERMLEPTTTSDREEVPFLTAEGFADYEKEVKRWQEAGAPKEGKPQADDYVAVLKVGVNATGLQDAVDALLAAQAAQAKAAEAEAKAKEAAKAAANAQAVAKAATAANVDAATAKGAAEAAEAAKAAQVKAQQEAEAAKAKAAEAAQQQQQGNGRKPGGAVQQQAPAQNGAAQPAAPMTIATACDFLMKVAMKDDGKVSFAPSVVEQWQNLAAAIWRNPQLAHAFLIERDAQQKEAEAAKREAAKAKA